MKTSSIRTRLAVWYSFILALSLCAFGGVEYFALSNSLREGLDSGLEQRLKGARDIIAEDAPQGFAALQDELREYADGVGAQGGLRVANPSGMLIFASPGMELMRSKASPDEPDAHPTFGYERIKGRRFRVLFQSIEVAGNRYNIEMARSTLIFDHTLVRFRMVLGVAVPFVLILAVFGGDWMGRRALEPVDELTRTTREIGATDLSQRLVVPHTGDELERLGNTLNEMLARLENAFQQIKKFTADASHELRTPVSVIRASAEIALRKSRSEEEYREALSQILNESERVTSLIEQLLDLTHADAGPALLPLKRTNLREALLDACQEAKPLAEAKQLILSEYLPKSPLWVHGDTSSLDRLFLILLDNAIKYTPAGGNIEVRLDSEDGFAVAEVRDSGIGIATEDVPHIYDRFYRADRARTRESGGMGLGLAIGKWIVEAHHGEIRVESEFLKGSAFQVRLPLAGE